MTRFNLSMLSALAMLLVGFCPLAQSGEVNGPPVVVALAEIEQEGGTIDVEKSDGQDVSSLEASREKVANEEIKALRFLDLRNLQAALDESAKLKDVKYLEINFCWTGPRTISNTELDKIAAITSLEEIAIADATFEGKELKRLAKLANLKTIRLEEITAKGTVTDDHLTGLQSVPSLETIDVSKTKQVSVNAIKAFKKQRPKCNVISAPSPAKE